MMSSDNVIPFPTLPTDSFDDWIAKMRTTLLLGLPELEQPNLDAAIRRFRDNVGPLIKEYRDKTTLKVTQDGLQLDELERFTSDIGNLIDDLTRMILRMEMKQAMLESFANKWSGSCSP